MESSVIPWLPIDDPIANLNLSYHPSSPIVCIVGSTFYITLYIVVLTSLLWLSFKVSPYHSTFHFITTLFNREWHMIEPERRPRHSESYRYPWSCHIACILFGRLTYLDRNRDSLHHTTRDLPSAISSPCATLIMHIETSSQCARKAWIFQLDA